MKNLSTTFLILLGFHAGSALGAYPTREIRGVMSNQERRLDDIRTEEVQQLRVILKRSANSAQKADLLLRLGEVYTEKYRLYFFKENDIWNRRIDAFLKKNENRKKSGRRPISDHGASRRFLSKAIKQLERLVRSIDRYNKLDEVYYYLGFNYWEIGSKKKSVNYFNKIANKYPRSRYAPEAFRYLADNAFAQRKFKSALVFYKRAKRYKKSPSYPRVLYGLAWTQYKLRKNKSALNSMETAIRLARRVNESEAVITGVALQEDAYDALVLFYSRVGSSKRALRYFETVVGEKAAPELLNKLISNYQRQGKYGRALRVTKQLETVDDSVREEGTLKRFQILNNALKLAAQREKRTQVAAILKSMVAEFITKDSKNSEIRESIRNSLRNAALHEHKIGNKSKRYKRSQRRAISLYRLYLATFGSEIKKEDFYEIRFYLADSLSQKNRHHEAAKEFRFLVTQSLDDPDNKSLRKYRKQAAEGLIYSLDEYFSNRKRKRLSDAQIAELLSAIDAYAKLYPTSKDTLKFLSRGAGLLKGKSAHRVEYERRLLEIIGRFPKSVRARESAVLLVKDAEKKKDWPKVVAWVEQFLANPKLAKGRRSKFRKQLREVKAKARFKSVQKLEGEDDIAAAARGYEKLAAETKNREVRLKSLNNAAVSYGKAGEHEDELRIYKKIARMFPNRISASLSVLAVADKLFYAGEYEKAALTYEEFQSLHAKKFLRRKKRVQNLSINASMNAAFLRKALGQEELATKSVRRVVWAANKRVSSARGAAEGFLYDQAYEARNTRNTTEGIRAFKKYLSVFPNGKHSIEVTVQVGLLYSKLRESERSQSYFNKARRMFRKRGRRISRDERSYAAYGRLLLLNSLARAYFRSPIRLPERRLQKDIKTKLRRMERLIKGYLEVVEYGDGKYALEAFYRMALAYLEFARSLESAPAPNKYSNADKAKFKSQLRAMGRPVHLKVRETLRTALRKGQSLSVGDPVMAKVWVASALLSPQKGYLPLVQETKWEAKDWLMGTWDDEDDYREVLARSPKNQTALIAIGNYHLVKGQYKFARIYYSRAIKLNRNNAAAINNLAFLEGRKGKMQAALAGFKAALKKQEFSHVPKKNLGRVYMASGLWGHANLVYRQLEVRFPKDKEVVRGLGLSYLALGKLAKAKSLLDGDFGDGLNGRYAEAIFDLANGEADDAKSEFKSMASKSLYAGMVTKYWR